MLSQEGNSSVDSFEQFYSFHDDEFKKRVKVISMKEFIEREQNKLLTLNDKDYKRVLSLSTSCQNRRKSKWMKSFNVNDSILLVSNLCIDIIKRTGDIYCGEVFETVAAHSNTKIAPLGTAGQFNTCLIFDEDAFKNDHGTPSTEINTFCGVSDYVFRDSGMFFLFIYTCTHAKDILCNHVKNRKPVFYTNSSFQSDILHFDSYERDRRLLSK